MGVKTLNKRVFSCISLSLVFIMFLVSAGCGVRINGKEYEFYKSSQGDKKNNIFIGIGEASTHNQSITQNKIEGDEFKVSTSAGNVEITKSINSGIELEAELVVRGASAETKNTIHENMIVALEQKGDNVEVVIKTKDGKDFWKWHRENYKAYQITVNYNISLPDNFKDLDISTGAGNIIVEGVSDKVEASTGAGNIDFNNMKAEFSASTGAGNITIVDSSSLGKSKLSTGAGNIYFNGSVKEMDGFKASTGMGNLDFLVPADSKMTLDVDTGLGNLSGSFIKTNSENKTHFKGDVNGGGPSVELSTGVGNVNADED